MKAARRRTMSPQILKGARRLLAPHRARARGSYNKALMRKRGGFHNGSRIVAYQGGERGNQVIKKLLEGQDPVMVTRYGDTELRTISSVLSRGGPQELLMRVQNLHWASGFFPARAELLPRFVEVYEEAAREIDCLAIWNFEQGRWGMEERMFRDYSPDASLVSIRSLESWLFPDPWTSSLRGERVLVVHPFAESIRQQYAKRTWLFEDERVLPRFEALLTLETVQSVAGNPTRFETWFDALDAMCSVIKSMDFDVALIGAGAYGMPLAAYVKKLGKKAVHMGGVTQILFGIMGRRWEKPIPGGYPPLTRFFNDHWTRPLPKETPPGFEGVDRGAYW
jgi:hypothetical protein